MKAILTTLLGLLLGITLCTAQEATTKLSISAFLIDRDLNVKPVPKLALSIAAEDQPAVVTTVSTDIRGVADLHLAPGKYLITSVRPIEFQGKQYEWKLEVVISGTEQKLELSNDNSTFEPLKTASSDDIVRELFASHQNSVVTVWAEVGPAHGSGFLIDQQGLVLTNQHVVSTSEFIAVEFDKRQKLRATLLASDPEKDVAVLWVNVKKIGQVPAALSLLKKGDLGVVEGERVLTIGSPLHQRKIVTTGIASKIEERAIISDININPGNSGGPLLNASGTVIGITTFGDMSRSGPGVSGIVRIEEALPIIERAREKMTQLSTPSEELLPNDPTDRYPIDAIKAAAAIEKFKTDPYLFGVGDYEVAVITPILRYRGLAGEVRAAREKEKRNKKSAQAVQGTFAPLQDLRGWREYVGDYEPVLLVQAQPKLKETFWSAFGRGMAAAGGAYYTGAARMRFKTDFYKMKLFCGSKEVQPLAPGKMPIVLDEQNAFINVTDATFAGLYKYPADAITSSCGQVSLHLFSEKEPNNPKIKVLEAKTIQAVIGDFAPYIITHQNAASALEKAKDN